MTNKKIIEKIKDEYRIDIDEISFIRESPDNKVYLIKKDKEKFILRVSKRDVKADVLFEVSWLDYLSKRDIPVPKIRKTADGKPFIVFQQSAIVVFEFIYGSPLKIDKNHKPNLKKVKNAAYQLAKIHNASFKADLNLSRKRDIFTEIGRALKIKDKFIKLADGGKKFIKELEFYQKWAKRNVNDDYLIHNDFHPGNILFDDDRVSAILDFDWSCQGPAIKDVAHSLVLWSFPDGAKSYWEDIFNLFLVSYNQMANSKIQVDNSLYHWICFSCLSDAATYFADLATENKFKKITSSFMYQKFLYFKSFIK